MTFLPPPRVQHQRNDSSTVPIKQRDILRAQRSAKVGCTRGRERKMCPFRPERARENHKSQEYDDTTTPLTLKCTVFLALCYSRKLRNPRPYVNDTNSLVWFEGEPRRQATRQRPEAALKQAPQLYPHSLSV